MTPAIQSDIHISPAETAESQLSALLHGAGISPLQNTGWIRATGEDRVRWLNGMVTNSIQQLQPGQGNYNFLLSVQGRIQGDVYIFATPDALLLETSSAQIPNLLTLLDRFIIMDDVELTDVTHTRTGFSVIGPKAASLLAQIGLPVEHLNPLETQTIPWSAADVTIIHTYSPLVPRFELWTDAATAATLTQALLTANAALCAHQSLDWLRILEGTPLYGTDIRDRELPQETGQTRALHFAKGCYLGQEIVERIRSRGNVHRTFSAFRLEGALPAAGAILEVDSKPVGELTSIAAIPFTAAQGNLQLALGYVRREALDRATPLHYPGGVATPVPHPYPAVAALSQRPASDSSERV